MHRLRALHSAGEDTVEFFFCLTSLINLCDCLSLSYTLSKRINASCQNLSRYEIQPSVSHWIFILPTSPSPSLSPPISHHLFSSSVRLSHRNQSYNHEQFEVKRTNTYLMKSIAHREHLVCRERERERERERRERRESE